VETLETEIELGVERLFGHERIFGGFVNSTLDDLQTQVTVNAGDIELGKERLFGIERLFSDIGTTLENIVTSITNLQTDLTTETTQREATDATLQTNIDNISLTPGPEGPAGADGFNLKTYVLKELNVGSRSGPSLACDTGDIALSGGFAKSPDDLIHFMFVHPDVLDRVQFGTQDIDDLANIDLYTVCADTTAPFRP